MRIVVGVSGGIAAYKAVLVLRLLTEAGHQVRVIPTDAALEFVGKATWEALSHQPVTNSVFDGADTVDHVRLGREAELVIVVPATADLLARAATGRADDLLTATLLTVTGPVVYAPAMHTEMWQHPATRANVTTLRAHGAHVLEVASGRLTGTDTGPGRLPDPEDIVAAALHIAAQRPDDDGAGAAAQLASGGAVPGDGAVSEDSVSGGAVYGQVASDEAVPEDAVADDALAGWHLAISAGGTREPLDPVRFLGNRSSGRQGVALARVAAQRGATVHLAAANVDDALLAGLPATVQVSPVETTAELQATMTEAATEADAVIMAAAVADYRPVQAAETKIKTHDAGGNRQAAPTIELTANPDILAGLVEGRREGQVIVGFAAETGVDDAEVLDHGRAKAHRKQADLLAVNRVGTHTSGFGDVPNAVVVLDRHGREVVRAGGTKDDVAAGLLDAITAVGRPITAG